MSNRVLRISAKCSDLCFASVPHLGIDHDGYAPHIDGIGGGDYIDLEIDLDTGKVIGLKPITDEQLKIAILGED